MSDATKWLLLGLLSILFSIFVLGNSVLATMAVTTLTGALFLVSGGFQIVAGFGADSLGNKIWAIVLGAILAFLGWSFMAHPLQGAISLTMLVVILLAASGIMRIIFAMRMKETRFFWPMLLSGAISVLLAGYIMANFAAATLSLLGILLGIELLFNGIGLVIMSFFIRQVEE